MYRLLALDLDGTLLGRDGEVSDRDRRAIDKLRALMAFQVSTSSSCPVALTSRSIQALINVLWRVDVHTKSACVV